MDIIVSDINRLHKEAHECARTALEKALQCGELLIQQKASLEHGQWEDWCKDNLDFSYPQATRYMTCAKYAIKISREIFLEQFDSIRQVEEQARKERAEAKAQKEREQAAEDAKERERKRQERAKQREEDLKEHNEKADYGQSHYDKSEMTMSEALDYIGLGRPMQWESVEIVLKAKIQRSHPDKGGDPEEFKKIQEIKSFIEKRMKV